MPTAQEAAHDDLQSFWIPALKSDIILYHPSGTWMYAEKMQEEEDRKWQIFLPLINAMGTESTLYGSCSSLVQA